MSDRPADVFERQYGRGVLRYDQSFRTLRRLLRPWMRERTSIAREVVSRLAEGRERSRLLDFGCGEGSLALQLANELPSFFSEIVGIDVTASRIGRAQAGVAAVQTAAVGPRLRFVVGDEALVKAVQGGGFDIVTCLAVFSHIYDVYGLARTLREALVPGGYLVAEFQNLAYLRRRWQLLVGRLPTISPADMALWPEIGWDSGHIHHFTLRTCVRFLQQCRFEVVAAHPTGLLANVFKVWPSLLSTGVVIVAKRTP